MRDFWGTGSHLCHCQRPGWRSLWRKRAGRRRESRAPPSRLPLTISATMFPVTAQSGGHGEAHPDSTAPKLPFRYEVPHVEEKIARGRLKRQETRIERNIGGEEGAGSVGSLEGGAGHTQGSQHPLPSGIQCASELCHPIPPGTGSPGSFATSGASRSPPLAFHGPQTRLYP